MVDPTVKSTSIWVLVVVFSVIVAPLGPKNEKYEGILFKLTECIERLVKTAKLTPCKTMKCFPFLQQYQKNGAQSVF